MATGSSPPAWGTHGRFIGYLESDGLIPTCVGNTGLLDFVGFAWWAHPHLRGEHVMSSL